MSHNDIPPRDDEDPRERELSRRSATPALSLWLIIGLLIMLGFGAYALFALI